jgi:predicted Zn-dependent protease
VRAATAALGAVLLAGCATTNLPPVSSPDFRLEDEERAMWRVAEKESQRLDDGGDVYEDPALEQYVNDVLRKVSPPGLKGRLELRAKVVRNYRLNAFALPNGAIYVHTGMLARMTSEAELAVLLGHELTHATHRHAVREQRSASNWSGAMAGVSAATLGLASPLGNLAAAAAVSGFSKDSERESDRVGLSLVARAGYDVSAAPELFGHLAEFVKEESDGEEEEEPFFFGSHPRLEERRESCEKLLATEYRGQKGVRNEEVFRRRTAALLLVNAQLALEAGRFAAAERDARAHLAINPRSATALALVGEASRRRGEPKALRDAVEYYRKALQLDAKLPEAHRGLGLALHKLGDRSGARAELSRYLELDPRALDRAHVKALLDRPEERP